jgi:hypothetical protein
MNTNESMRFEREFIEALREDGFTLSQDQSDTFIEYGEQRGRRWHRQFYNISEFARRLFRRGAGQP